MVKAMICNQQKVATSGAGLVNQTVNISGQYHAFGGVVYYSIYDVRGKWLGYVDASQVKTTSSAAGLWLPHDGYLTTTQSGQMIYTNLDSLQVGGRPRQIIKEPSGSWANISTIMVQLIIHFMTATATGWVISIQHLEARVKKHKGFG
ncbi:D-alanyl-D-alanine carboxypeptidase [Lacticaseibacillus paracasei]|nr:D-alanyl-D-alanine carboxypeptidase [Lacticaseibacillus paracasei]